MSCWTLLHFGRTAKKTEPPAKPKKNFDPYGLHILYPLEGPNNTYDPSLRKIDIDIIAVHGLDGDPFATWTESPSGSNWLQDFLPNALPNARIMTFGYNSVVKFSNSVSTIEDFANELLNRIRLRHMNRPLIFICHSLGGIVVKKALILANEKGERFEFIKRSCRGIVFLGTPHRGSRAGDLGRILSAIVNSLTLSSAIRTPLLNDLRSGSGALQTISKQFVMRSRDLQIVSFYEREVMRSGPLSILVVDEDSATIGTVNEATIPINANHHTMCKFSSEECPRYELVKGNIVDMVRNVLAVDAVSPSQDEELHQQILEWLSTECPEPLDGVYESKSNEREDGTCNWFWEHDNVKGWLSGDRNSSIFWVHGPPGVGKSVLCSSIISKLIGEQKVVAYFFCVSSQQSELGLGHDSTAPKPSSAEFIVRSLIVQLLGSDVYCRIPNKLKEIYKRHMRGKSAITLGSLKMILQSILDICPRTYIIIDGLDELDELNQDNPEQLKKLLKVLDLQTLGIVKWLLVSQKTKAVDETLSHLKDNPNLSTAYRELDLAEVDHEIRGEIKAMIKTAIDRKFSDHSQSDKLPIVVLGLLVALTGGNFLCARLLLEELNRRPSLEDIMQLMSEYEPGLEHHYVRALKRMASVKNRSWVNAAKKTLMLIALALKPLTVCEVQAALGVNVEVPGELCGKQGMFANDIEKLCLPLVRVCPKKKTMKMVHHSVRAFLMKQLGKPETWNTTDIEDFFIDEEKGHTTMALICLSYLSKEDYSNFPLTDIPEEKSGEITTIAMAFDKECEGERNRFVKYAAIFWHMHADEAQVTPDLVRILVRFFKSQNFITCLRVRSISAPYHFGTFVSVDGLSVAFADTIPGWLESTKLLPGSEGMEMAFQYYSFVKEWGHVLVRYPGEIERCLIGTLGNIFFPSIKTMANAHFLDEGNTMQSIDVDAPSYTSIADLSYGGWVLTLKIKPGTTEYNQPATSSGCTKSQIKCSDISQSLTLWHYDRGNNTAPQLRWSLSKVADITFGKSVGQPRWQHLNCCKHPMKSNPRTEWPSDLSPLVASPALDYAIMNGCLFKLRSPGSEEIHNLQSPLIEFKFPSVLCKPLGICLGTNGKYLAIGATWECQKCLPDEAQFDDESDDGEDSDDDGSSGAGSDADEDTSVFAGTSFASAPPTTTYAYFKLLVYDSSKLDNGVPLFELGTHCRANGGKNPFHYSSPAFHHKQSLVAWAPGPGKIIVANYKTKDCETQRTAKMSRNSHVIARELQFSQRGDFLYEIKITVRITENASFHRGKIFLITYPIKSLNSPLQEVQHFNWKLKYPGARVRDFKAPTTSWTADSAYISFSNIGLSVCRIDLQAGATLYTARTTMALPTSALQRSVRFISVGKKDAIVALEGSVGYGSSLISVKGLDWDERDWGSEVNLTITGGMNAGVFYECDEPSFIVPVRSGAVWTERQVLQCS